MTDHEIHKRLTPTILGQKSKPIVVVDTVKVRYDNTSDYLYAKVLVIDDGHMTVQWDDPQGQDATVNVPHASVCSLGTDGTYSDDCSALVGVSSSKANSSKRKWTSPQPTECPDFFS